MLGTMKIYKVQVGQSAGPSCLKWWFCFCQGRLDPIIFHVLFEPGILRFYDGFCLDKEMKITCIPENSLIPLCQRL